MLIERGKELDRDAPREVGVFGEIDYTHAAFAQFLNYSIMRDRLANHEMSFEAEREEA